MEYRLSGISPHREPAAPAVRRATRSFAARRGLAWLAFLSAVLAGAGLFVRVLSGVSDREASLLAGLMLACSLWGCIWALRLDPLSPAMVYLGLFALFHLGLVVPWALGIRRNVVPGWVHTNQLGEALGLVILALAAFQAGAALAVWFGPRVGPSGPQPVYCNHPMYCAGLGIVALGALSFLWGVNRLGYERLLQVNYFETYALLQQYDPRLFISSLTVVPIGLYLAAAACPRDSLLTVGGVGLGWTVAILFLGFRGYALVPAVTVIAILNQRGVRLARVAAGMGAVFLLFVIPVVRGVRDSRLGTRIPPLNALEDADPLAALEEMGGSLRPLVHTLQFMQTEPPRWGGTYWRALKSALPNVSLEWQGRPYVPLEELPPSHWVTSQAAPYLYRIHGGIGFSAVAEPYMNFGTPGVAAYFLLLGLTLVRVEQKCLARPTRLAAWGVVLGPLLWTTRNDFHALFRPAILGLLCMAGVGIVSSSLHQLLAHRRRLGPATRRGRPRTGEPRRWRGLFPDRV